jgi:hypothetical protein
MAVHINLVICLHVLFEGEANDCQANNVVSTPAPIICTIYFLQPSPNNEPKLYYCLGSCPIESKFCFLPNGFFTMFPFSGKNCYI